VRVEEDSAAFYVRGFSTNTVTFSGEVQITGDPADNGSQYSYDIADLDSGSNVTVNMTGVSNSVEETESGTGNGTISVAGSEPTDAEVTATRATNSNPLVDDNSPNADGGDDYDPDYNAGHPTDYVDYVIVEVEWTGGGTYNDVAPDVQDDTGRIGMPPGHDLEDGVPYRYNISVNSALSGDLKIGALTDSDLNIRDVEVYGEIPTPEVTVGGETRTLTESSTTWTVDNLSVGENPVTTTRSDVSWSVTYNETTPTTDPGVELNTCSVSHTGTLNEGETVTKTMNESCIGEGTNTVNVSPPTTFWTARHSRQTSRMPTAATSPPVRPSRCEPTPRRSTSSTAR